MASSNDKHFDSGVILKMCTQQQNSGRSVGHVSEHKWVDTGIPSNGQGVADDSLAASEISVLLKTLAYTEKMHQLCLREEGILPTPSHTVCIFTD